MVLVWDVGRMRGWVISRLHHLRIMLLLKRRRRQIGRGNGLRDHGLGLGVRERVLRLVESVAPGRNPWLAWVSGGSMVVAQGCIG